MHVPTGLITKHDQHTIGLLDTRGVIGRGAYERCQWAWGLPVMWKSGEGEGERGGRGGGGRETAAPPLGFSAFYHEQRTGHGEQSGRSGAMVLGDVGIGGLTTRAHGGCGSDGRSGHIHKHACMQDDAHTATHARQFTNARNTHTYKNACIHACMHTHTHTGMHTRMHTRSHTYTHALTLAHTRARR